MTTRTSQTKSGSYHPVVLLCTVVFFALSLIRTRVPCQLRTDIHTCNTIAPCDLVFSGCVLVVLRNPTVSAIYSSSVVNYWFEVRVETIVSMFFSIRNFLLYENGVWVDE